MLAVLDTEQAYAAEAEACHEVADERHIAPDQLSAWTRCVLRPAGWPEAPSTFVFDPPGDDTRAGWRGTAHV